MLLLLAPTDAACIHLVDAAVCMFPAADGTVVAAEVVVPPDKNCFPVVGAATAAVVVVAIVAASVAVAAIVAVSVVAVISGIVAVGGATLTSLSVAIISTLLVCLAQICPSPFFCHYPPLSCSCSTRQHFVLRAHAWTFVHVGLIMFEIRQVDFILAQCRTPVPIMVYVVST